MKGGLLPRGQRGRSVALRSTVTNWLSCAGRRAVALRAHLRALPHFLGPSLNCTACLYYRRIRDTYTFASRDYISLLDNTTGRCVGTIKTNVTPGDADWTALSFLSLLLPPRIKRDGDLYWHRCVKFRTLTFKKRK